MRSVATIAVSLVAALALVGAAPACRSSREAPSAETAPSVALLDSASEPLRRAFDEDPSRVRLLLLASPTCGECLHGVATVDDEVMKKIAASDLAAYVVWIPMLPGDDATAARAAAGRFGDPRIRHFWDPDRALGRVLGERLAIPKTRANEEHGVAWDVYLLYARGAGWPAASAPPIPGFWMNQLDRLDVALSPKLDGATLRRRVEEALASR